MEEQPQLEEVECPVCEEPCGVDLFACPNCRAPLTAECVDALKSSDDAAEKGVAIGCVGLIGIILLVGYFAP